MKKKDNKSISDNFPASKEVNLDRQGNILSNNTLTLDLISAMAGDRQLTPSEMDYFSNFCKIRGLKLYSDILYCLTHQLFAPEIAKDLWENILVHKRKLSTVLKRNVRIVVAALDYLSNITDNIVSTTLVGESDFDKIIERSLHDGLTGLFNHTYFYHELDLEMKRYTRYSVSLSLILIDVDDFKDVNDKFGHREGDRILASMSYKLMSVARDSDICCRYGGEEFAVILPLTNINEASLLATRIQNEIVEYSPCGEKITTSIGVATSGESVDTYEKLVELADKALYKAKGSGKDQVIVMI